MTMITPSYLGETIEYSSLHACRSTLEDPTRPRLCRQHDRQRRVPGVRSGWRIWLHDPRLSGGVGLLCPRLPWRRAPWVAPWPSSGAAAQRRRRDANALPVCSDRPDRAVRESGTSRLQLWSHHRTRHCDGDPERHCPEACCARPDDYRPHLDHCRHFC